MERGRLMSSVKRENIFTKKIGDAKYQVKIIFNHKSTESFNDKILRLIKNDLAKYGLKKINSSSE